MSLIFLLCLGCTKQNDSFKPSNPINNQSSSFKIVKLNKFDRNNVDVTWTKPTGTATDTSVRYEISINNAVVGKSIKDTVFTVNKILATLNYQGKVIATNTKGVVATTNFTIDAESGFLYTNIDQNNMDCYTTTGLFVWEQPIGYSAFTAVSNDTLFVQTSFPPSNNRMIYALNTKTGQVDWTITDPTSLLTSSSNVEMLYDGNGIVFSVNVDKTISLDAKSGKQLWQISNFGYNLPVAGDGLLYSVSQGATQNDETLIAYNSRSGSQVWQYAITGAVFGLPSESNGTTFIVDSYSSQTVTGYNSDLYSFDSKSGTKKWTRTFEGLIGTVGNQSKPLVLGSTVLVSMMYGTTDGRLYAFDKDNGNYLWSVSATNGYLLGDASSVYVNALNRGMSKYDLKTGTIIWSNNLLAYSMITPTLIYSHSDNPYNLLPDYFNSHDPITGNGVLLNLLGLETVGSFTAIINGTVYYLPQNGMYKGI